MKRHVQHIYNAKRATKSAEDMFFAAEKKRGGDVYDSSSPMGGGGTETMKSISAINVAGKISLML